MFIFLLKLFYFFRIQSGPSMELASDGARSVSNLASIFDWCVEDTQAQVTEECQRYTLHPFHVAIDGYTKISDNAYCKLCRKCSKIHCTLALLEMLHLIYYLINKFVNYRSTLRPLQTLGQWPCHIVNISECFFNFTKQKGLCVGHKDLFCSACCLPELLQKAKKSQF